MKNLRLLFCGNLRNPFFTQIYTEKYRRSIGAEIRHIIEKSASPFLRESAGTSFFTLIYTEKYRRSFLGMKLGWKIIDFTVNGLRNLCGVKIHQYPNPQIGQLQVRDQLFEVNLSYCLHGLYFNNHLFLDK